MHVIGAAQYHFHERMTCLYEQSGGHSPKIGEANDGTPIYGMWENYEARELPLLDACGGQFGVTPDSSGEVVYHYHVQSKPPFTFGCYGPAMDGGLVTVEECRATYTECGDGDVVDLTTKDGTFEYDHWCPCYDANGHNTGTITEQPAIAASENSFVAENRCTYEQKLFGECANAGGSNDLTRQTPSS